VRHRRARELRRRGADDALVQELLDYGGDALDIDDLDPQRVPLPDEPHVSAWRDYAARGEVGGLYDVLEQALVQLRFPVRAGISATDAYKAATLQGLDPAALPGATGLELQNAAELQLRMQQTPGGTVPVLVPRGRADFESLVRALTARNEPVDVPASMGAATVVGYNNWDRVSAHRADWLGEHAAGDWAAEFQRMLSHKELYQDRFLIISDGPYSAVPAHTLGLDDEHWRRSSVVVRAAHEGTHYTMKRILGVSRNRMHDELIADYMGIVAAHDSYRCDWFLHFIGLEDRSRYREGGRLQNYRGEPPLSDAAFRLLQGVVADAADNLEAWDASLQPGPRSAREQAVIIAALATTSLEEIASQGGCDALAAAARRAEGCFTGV